MEIEESVDIAAPPDRVWRYLVEPARILEWYTLLRRFEFTGDSRSGVGATFDMDEQAGPLLRLQCEVTEWSENQAIAFRMRSGNLVNGYVQRWSMAPAPGGTRFTFWEDVTMPCGALGKVLGAVGRSSSRAHVRHILANLKALAETGTPG